MTATEAGRRVVAQRWSQELSRWAIPDDVLVGAPASPWVFDPKAFRPVPNAPLNQTQLAILTLLDRCEERSVLDVGAGAGAGVLPIAGSIRSLVALDQDAAMLGELALASESVPEAMVETRVGDFFALENGLGRYDVVTSQNVVYNIDDLFGFLEGLIAHARTGVVLEMTLHHPHYGLNLLWQRFHQLQRPTTPDATDVIEALVILGVTPRVFVGPPLARIEEPAQRIVSTRRRLCLAPSDDVAIQEALDEGLVLTNPSVTLVCELLDA
ncbi:MULTISPECIES: class I SAM-dependent methyltransferase [Ferrimicrobium]|uniref:Class I SAM-dependent methyltransferase n=1 Tax=Ferrimicrobium acidiphilum TaxID=121039 RepID=A0ABV3Y4B6_9ACTN|nr:class I SAM-dependent methyltransferase [Ferrimicrobium sp.]